MIRQSKNPKPGFSRNNRTAAPTASLASKLTRSCANNIPTAVATAYLRLVVLNQ